MMPIKKNRATSIPALLSGASMTLMLGTLLVSPVLTACGDDTNSTGGSGTTAAGGTGPGVGGSGGAGGGMGGAGGSGTGGAPADPCNYAHDSEVNVSDAAGLKDALTKAVPGQLIRLAAGTYADSFDITIPGTTDKPIVLCGPREAILDSTTKPTNTGLRVIKADFWIVSGISITGGRKGIFVDGSSDTTISDVAVHDVGEQAIQIRNGASRTTVQYCEITNTGMTDATNAEGIYVGSAYTSWTDLNTPDKCDNTKILWNKIGPGVKTEHVDVKEGTTGGEVRGNTFDGTGITGANSEDSWVACTGNGYTFAENVGTNSPKDGFQVRQATMGWGDNNVFEKNTATVDSPNFGIYITPGPMGTVVKCDNMIIGTAMISNITCTP